MVQPFGNIPKLEDPGVSSAISGSSNLINNLLGLKQQREANTQSFINQLLRNKGDIQAANINAESRLQSDLLNSPMRSLKTASDLLSLQRNLKLQGKAQEAQALQPQIDALLASGNLSANTGGSFGSGQTTGTSLADGSSVTFDNKPPAAADIGFGTTTGFEGVDVLTEQERAKTAQEQAQAIQATEQGRRSQQLQQTQAADIVVNPQTGVEARQPSLADPNESKPIPNFSLLRTQRQRLFQPDGSLTPEGQQVSASVNVLTSSTGQLVPLLKQIAVLDKELNLDMNEKAALATVTPDSLRLLRPKASDTEIQKIADFKQLFDELESIKLAVAAEKNKGRPTDKDFSAIAAAFPKLFSSREKLYSAIASQLVAAEAANLNARLLMGETDAFTELVPEFQKLTGQEYTKDVYLNPKVRVDTMKVIDSLTNIPNETNVVTLDQASPQTPITPSGNTQAPTTPRGLSQQELLDLARRYRGAQ